MLYADADDPSLWSNLDLEGVNTIMLAMPELNAKMLATKELRKFGYTGKITTTVVFEEEIILLKEAGADYIYNYYNGVGASFAQSSLNLK